VIQLVSKMVRFEFAALFFHKFRFNPWICGRKSDKRTGDFDSILCFAAF
jgi:hypothetical protein